MLFYLFPIIAYFAIIKKLNANVRATQSIDGFLRKEAKYNRIQKFACIIATILVILFGTHIVGLACFGAIVITVWLLGWCFYRVKLNVIGEIEQWSVFLAVFFRYGVISTIMIAIMYVRVSSH